MEKNEEQIFEEWDAYSLRKELHPRHFDLDGMVKNSRMKVIAVTGIRRAGKTSLLILLRQKLAQEDRKVKYLNLEDSRLKNDPQLLDKVIKWFGESGYLILDEITNAQDWESWVARTHEMLKGKLNLILSSSRKGLSIPSKSLRGRILAYESFPLSFQEFLEFKSIKQEFTTYGRGQIEKALEEYLIYGGFPEVVLSQEKNEKIQILSSYFRDIIGLDVAEISKENISVVELFGKYIVDAPYFSASKCLNFFKSLGHKTSKTSLLHLEKFSQESYLFFFLSIFSYTIKDRSQYSRKSYLGDLGFLYAISGRVDWGRLYENAVFLELKRRTISIIDINYWKNQEGKEVDFILREGTKTKEIIQVVYDLKDKKTVEREVESLKECAKALRIKKGLIITKDLEKVEEDSGIVINYMPLWKWLLK